MKLKMLFPILIGFLFATQGAAMNEIRTYMSFTNPVDPAGIQTIPDMDMSYALASTLIKWGQDKELSAGLADKWEITDSKTYRFTIRQDARWSDGKPVTCREVVKSLERGLKAHPTDLRSLAQILDRLECHSEREIDFHLKVAASDSGLLKKLTEPNYCVLKLDAHDKPDLSVTTGPFFLQSSSDSQLVLSRNRFWFLFDAGSPEQVTIRRPAQSVSLENVLLSDFWPNLVETSSLIDRHLLEKYKTERFEIWKRPLDKVFLFQLGKRAPNASGTGLLRFLRKKAKASDFVVGLSGFTPTAQLFPRGYLLFDPSFPSAIEDDVKLPEVFSKRAVEIVISPSRVSAAMRENIRRTIQQATGIEPHFTAIPLEEVRQYKVRGDYDLYAGVVGLADPDPEGAMSFYLEGPAPTISSTGNKFIERLDAARKDNDKDSRLGKMRSILTDAVREGFIYPIFHLSTIGLGRSDLDFSNIPQSDESVTLSRIRFKAKK